MEQQNVSPHQTVNSDTKLTSNNNKKLIITGVIMLLLVGFGSYFLGTKSQLSKQTSMVEVTPTMKVVKDPTSTSIPTQIPSNSPVATKHLLVSPMANWKTYTFNKKGANFEFKIPPDVTVSESFNSEGYSVQNPENFYSIGLDKLNLNMTNGLPQIGSPPIPVIQSKTVTLENRDSFTIQLDEGNNIQVIDVNSPRKHDLYPQYIKATYKRYPISREQALQNFNTIVQILSTFKVLN